VENGGGVVKKWTFPQHRVHYVQYRYFLFYILLIWGVRIRTQRIPLPTGLGDKSCGEWCHKSQHSRHSGRITPLWGGRNSLPKQPVCNTA